MASGSSAARRARPLPEVPVDALAARAEELAKQWLIELLEREPLAHAPAIAAAGLAEEGASICVAVLRALADDGALDAIESGGTIEGVVARAGAASGARAPEEVSWAVEALRGVVWRAVRRVLADAHADDVSLLAERLALVVEVVRRAALRELQEAWPAQLEGQIERARRTGEAMSLLLVELEEADKLLAIEGTPAARELLAELDAALRGAVRPGDEVVSRPGGRAWVIAPGTGRSAAEELGSRLGQAARSAPRWRGAPLRVSVGVAVLREDGSDAAVLMDTAEERRFEASACGIEISRRGAD